VEAVGLLVLLLMLKANLYLMADTQTLLILHSKDYFNALLSVAVQEDT